MGSETGSTRFTSPQETTGDGNRFTQDANYQRFDDTMPYETTATTCSIWSITLHGVVGGNAATEGLPADQFPSLHP